MLPSSLPAIAVALVASANLVSGHASIFHPSMFGFNESTAPNRPQDPLSNLPFDQWWFHGHLDKPPNDGDFFDLPAGGVAHTEISCDKGATSFYNTSAGGDARDLSNPDYPCPGQPLSEFHTNGINDLGGCALAIAYKSDASQVQPADFAVFSVNQTCVWTLHTDFEVPASMPACPEGGCTCAWFWIHKADSGQEQMYMTGFKCKVTGATSATPISSPQLARRCGADPNNGVTEATPSNCTYGAKQPFYWYQADGNTFFEGTYSPPLYTDLYNFQQGAQNDIFAGAASSVVSDPASTSTSTSSYHGPSKRWPRPTGTPARSVKRVAPLTGEHHARHAWGQHRRILNNDI
ncbi:hypothetical protein EW146_g1872 [Bondarzewia mesenterica]|uniref:Chitin-binding type-4 domain-containing protein n=1 Tax=Bondarzewia mesenterica TaxID=1095465 RepID=A0A4S4M2J4_9AGAM|nr:hypothetical protein EW146_g1872 [Bondarzewia mesenterica]